MIGFLIGTACLIGLIVTLRRGRGWHRHGWRGRGGWGPRAWLNRVFSRLETSPSQEKLIVAAVDDVRGTVSVLRGEVGATRADLVRVLREESFDAERVGEVFARHDEALRQLRATVTESLEKVHGALDHNQREALARMLESGPWSRRAFRSNGSPYRDSVAI